LEVLTVEVLEVGQLDALPHAQNIGGGAEAVEHHPQVAGVQGGHGLGSGFGRLAHAAQSVLDICPGRNDGAEDHQAKREESHRCDGASEPKHLAVCDQDDGQVLEDGVDGDREELERPCARVDHADEQEGDGKPWCCQSSYSRRYGLYVHFLASSVLKSLYEMMPMALHMEMATTQTTAWTQSRKKLRLKSTPDRTYLFVTVMRIEDPQYPRMAATGFSVMEPPLFWEGRMTGEGALELRAEGL
jgi:hypothetical protein